MVKKMNVPKLRFPEFNDEWITDKIGKFVSINSGESPSKFKFYNQGIPYYKVEQLNNSLKYQIQTPYYINTNKVIPKGSIIFPKRGAAILLNKIRILSFDSFFDTNIMSLTVNGINNEFLYYYLIKENLSNIADTSSIPQLNNKHIEPYPLIHPCSLNEQEKIGETLSLLDKKIELQTKKIEDLKLFKKGLFTNLKFNNTSLIKFKDILDEVNEKSVVNNQYEILSSTAHGLFLQKEYFNKQAASDINMGYKILRKNQLVLSPQNLWMGNININDKYNIGIVSPSYKIFKINANIINIDYFNNWIKSPRALYEYKISSEQGASVVRRNLNMDLFNEITLKIPNMQTQNKIGKQISNINNLIELENCKLVRLKKLKKGLMQCMFV